MELVLCDPAVTEREICTKAHPSCHSMTVKHPSRELITGTPCVTIGVRSALMRLKHVTVLRSHVARNQKR